MDRNLPDKCQSVPLQSSVDEVPDYATLFDMTLVLTIVFSLLCRRRDSGFHRTSDM
jgi:hypothetical protein